MSGTDADYRCPVCSEWRVIPSLIADHIKKEHPDVKPPR